MDETDDEQLTLRDQIVLVEALYEIAHESSEAEIVRSAFAALCGSESGRQYLNAHPFTV